MARTFSGLQSEDVEEFLEYVDQLLESNNWSQARAAAKVKARLMGAAATYVRVLKDVGLPLNKWSTTKPEDADRPDTLRQRLLVRFGKPITPVELCNMTRDLKMSDAESVQDFYYRALRIVQKKQIRLNPDILTGTEEFERVCENDHFILFVNGLPTAMREKVLGVQAPPERSIDCLSACINIERQIKEEEALRKVSMLAIRSPAIEVDEPPPERLASVSGQEDRRTQQQFSQQNKSKEKKPQFKKRNVNDGSWYRKVMGQMRGRCFECGVQGHMRNECPKKQNMATGGTGFGQAKAVSYQPTSASIQPNTATQNPEACEEGSLQVDGFSFLNQNF